jgi:hypothetical protein
LADQAQHQGYRLATIDSNAAVAPGDVTLQSVGSQAEGDIAKVGPHLIEQDPPRLDRERLDQ